MEPYIYEVCLWERCLFRLVFPARFLSRHDRLGPLWALMLTYFQPHKCFFYNLCPLPMWFLLAVFTMLAGRCVFHSRSLNPVSQFCISDIQGPFSQLIESVSYIYNSVFIENLDLWIIVIKGLNHSFGLIRSPETSGFGLFLCDVFVCASLWLLVKFQF